MIALAMAALAASAPIPDRIDAVTYTDGRVVYAAHAFAGQPLVLRERPLAGGPPRVIATIPRTGDPRESMTVSLAANAGGYLITIRTPDSDRVIHGGYDGSLRTLVECTPESGNSPHLAAVAGTSGFAFAGTRCDPGVGVVGADGSLTPLPDIRSNFGHGLAYAEPYLAVSDLETVNLIDLSTGARRALDHIAFGTGIGLAVQPDGTVYSGNGVFGDGVYVWPPGAAQPHRLFREKGVFGVIAAGGRVFVERKTSLGLAAGGRVVDIRAPGAGDARKPLAFDGRHAAFHSFSCSDAQQVTVVDVDAPPAGVDGCPVRVGAAHAPLRAPLAHDHRRRVRQRLPRRPAPHARRRVHRQREAPAPALPVRPARPDAPRRAHQRPREGLPRRTQRPDGRRPAPSEDQLCPVGAGERQAHARGRRLTGTITVPRA